LSIHLEFFFKCFLKCRKFGISLNLDKCAFMVFSRTILGFIMSKEGKVMDLKKVNTLVNMPIPTIPQEIQIFNEMALFYKCFIKNFASIMSPITNSLRSLKFLNGLKNVKMLGRRLKTSMYKHLL